jgi:hypothetical protein
MNTKFQSLTKNAISLFLVSASVAFLFTMYSCKDDASLLGADLIPDDDMIECFYDTSLTFSSFLVNQDRFYTKNLTSYNLGLMNSTFFGSTEVRIATQFEPVNYVWVYKDATIDSVVLFLEVDTIYGIKNINFPIHVYELDSAISEDPIYYSDSDIDNMYSVSKKLNTGYRIQGDTLLAFPLDIELANRIVEDSTIHRSDSLFLDKFKGICIIPENVSINGGQLFNINLATENTKIAIYYKDTLMFPYYFNKGDRFSTVKNDPAGSLLESFLENDPAQEDSLLFLQGLGGTTSKIILKNYMNWIGETKYSILKAELLMPIYSTNEPMAYTQPSKVFFAHMDEDSSYYQTIDATYGKFFDGALNNLNQHYRFDISQYLQYLLNGKSTDSSIYLKMVNNSSEANRVILDGNNIKLKVTYSKH